ncbi:hypothetical protein, partial [Thiolapillus sp.]|uniref:hypothetical protein n=1 Tax=Thiolapillus sp. TaxID=2017437 RepID=UPI003AF427A6
MHNHILPIVYGIDDSGGLLPGNDFSVYQAGIDGFKKLILQILYGRADSRIMLKPFGVDVMLFFKVAPQLIHVNAFAVHVVVIGIGGQDGNCAFRLAGQDKSGLGQQIRKSIVVIWEKLYMGALKIVEGCCEIIVFLGIKLQCFTKCTESLTTF